MTIWVKDLGTSWFGHTFAVSSEFHDGIVYKANSVTEAVKAYESDRDCNVSKVIEEA